MKTDLWAELPSPIKTEFRDAFRRYARQCYAREGLLLRDYVPACMGAHMPREDYLIDMTEEELPPCYVTTAFGECSSGVFARRLLEAGVYRPPEPLCYFPELLVIDKKRLGSRPAPECFADLADPAYQGELCLIANRGRPDPLLPLYLYKQQGLAGVERLMKNLGALAGPSVTLRSLGKAGNRYGSLLLMPALFARICEQLPEVDVLCPESGTLAEPILLFWREGIEPEREQALRGFFHSAALERLLQSAFFPMPPQPMQPPIDPCFTKQHLWTQELEQIRKVLERR